MQAIILAGGRGQRLMPLTAGCPKPLVPFMDRPILDHILSRLAQSGFMDVVIALGYGGDQIMGYVQDGRRWGLRIGYSREEKPLGTAGAVRLAWSAFPSREPVLVVSGDGITDFDLGSFYRRSVVQDGDATLLLANVDDPRPYGVVTLGKGGQVLRFVEKPTRLMKNAVVNTGIYVLKAELLEGIPVGMVGDFGHEWLPHWITQGKRVLGVVGSGYWSDVGTVDQYQAAHEAVLAGRMQLLRPIRNASDIRCRVDGPAFIAPGTEIDPTAHVGPYAVIGDGVRVLPWARVERAIFGKGTIVGAHSQVKGAVLGDRVRLESYSIIDENVVLGDRVHVGYGAHVFPGTRLTGETRVSPGENVYAHQVARDRLEQRDILNPQETIVKVW